MGDWYGNIFVFVVIWDGLISLHEFLQMSESFGFKGRDWQITHVDFHINTTKQTDLVEPS